MNSNQYIEMSTRWSFELCKWLKEQNCWIRSVDPKKFAWNIVFFFFFFSLMYFVPFHVAINRFSESIFIFQIFLSFLHSFCAALLCLTSLYFFLFSVHLSPLLLNIPYVCTRFSRFKMNANFTVMVISVHIICIHKWCWWWYSWTLFFSEMNEEWKEKKFNPTRNRMNTKGTVLQSSSFPFCSSFCFKRKTHLLLLFSFNEFITYSQSEQWKCIRMNKNQSGS